MTEYKAKQGDIIWLDFDPQAGHEQKGRRPALVISNNSFNAVTKISAMVCPITNTEKNMLFKIKLDNRTKTSGVVMCDQVKILDLSRRRAEYIETAPDEIVLEASDIVGGFVEILED
jgi:mRNA interferase MazF